MCDPDAIATFFARLQENIVTRIDELDGQARGQRDEWNRPSGGGGISHVFTSGDLIEKGGVNFSRVFGESLPSSATRRRPELADQPYEAMGVSVVLHPRNPYVPAAHMNVRFFTTRDPKGGTWWFGGGFDLTPCYGFVEDAVAWHRAAHDACAPFGEELYPRFKEACDRYFHLPHRNEARGIGGLFFDDFNELGPERSFALTRSIGEAFLPAWESIASKRRGAAYTEREKAFQRYRRGRYVEFNLLHDRGTRFGLQSGGRTESILMSLPPQVDFVYGFAPEPGSPEAALTREFLVPKDWLNANPSRTLEP